MRHQRDWLLTRAAPAIVAMVNLASQRGEAIRFPSFLLGVSKATSSVRVQSSTNMKNSELGKAAPRNSESVDECVVRTALGCPETPFPGKDGVMSGGSSRR